MSVIRMNALSVIVLCIQMCRVHPAPLQLFFNPYQRILMPPQQNLQQQLLELQAMQQINSIAPVGMNNQPMVVFLPNDQINMNAGIQDKVDNNQIENRLKSNAQTNVKGDSDSEVIDAEPIPVLEDQKAFLVLPNRRFSIGGFISSIPFLPIEINVPDTISWAYDGIASGISGIISIIGQRLPGPFKRPPTMDGTMPANLRTVINNLQMNKKQNMIRPIVMIPLGDFTGSMVPMQL